MTSSQVRFPYQNNSGQSMLMVIFIGILLFTSIPAAVLINNVNTKHQVDTSKGTKAFATAREGIAYAKLILARDWDNALAAPIATNANLSDCGVPVPITGPDGSIFRISCDRLPASQVQPYQVHVISTALEQDPGNPGQFHPVRTLEAWVSKQSVAVNLPEDVHAAVALEMTHAPAALPANSLDVHWGSISCLDRVVPLDLSLQAMGVAPYYPRVFGALGIIPQIPAASATTSPPATTTDNRQYWSFASLGFVPPINDQVDSTVIPGWAEGYTGLALAGTQTCAVTPAPTNASPPPAPYNGSTCYLNATDFTQSISLTSPAITFGTPTQPKILYINGNVAWTSLPPALLDLARTVGPQVVSDGAIIVNGDLTLNGPVGGATGAVNYPYQAKNEYAQNFTAWPCPNNATATCTPAPPFNLPIQFHGFIWVKGRLIVSSGNWVINGVVLVGDPANPNPAPPSTLNPLPQLQITAGASLEVLYDDQVSRAILVGKVQLQSDSVREIVPQ